MNAHVDSAALTRCITLIRAQLDSAERAIGHRIYIASVRHELLDDGTRLRVVAVAEGSQTYTAETPIGGRQVID